MMATIAIEINKLGRSTTIRDASWRLCLRVELGENLADLSATATKPGDHCKRDL